MNAPAPSHEPQPGLFSLQEAGLAALLMGLVNFIGAGLIALGAWPEEINGLAGNLAMEAGLALGVGAILFRRRLSWQDAFGLRAPLWPRAIAIGLLGCAALLPVTFLLHSLSLHLFTRWGGPAGDQPAIQWLLNNHDPLFRSLLFVQAVMIAPLCEELFFRGLLLQALRRHYSTPMAIGLSAFFFAAFHFNLPATLPLFAIASGFAVAYLYTRSLAAAIVMHAAYNLINYAWAIWLKP